MRRSGVMLGLLMISGACARVEDPSSDPGVIHLADAFRTADGALAVVARHTLGGIGREVVKPEPRTPVSASVLVPEGGTLRFAVTVSGPGGESPTGDCTAEVLLRADAREESLWRSERLDDRPPWREETIDLGAHAGKRVEIVLRSGGDARFSVLWGSPVVAGTIGDRHNLLLYEVDTLRPDRLEPLGFPGRSSPVLGSLARRGVLFPNCYSTASWTRPAATSILTSRSVPAHGIVGEKGVLPDDIETLTDVLRDRGWYTVAFQTNPNAGRPAGLDRGFDVVLESVGLMHHRRRHEERWEGEKTWTAVRASGTSELVAFALDDLLPGWADLPLFLYIHPMDPHDPYEPRAPFASLPGFERDGAPPAVNGPLADYGRDVRTADHFLGRILRQLEREEILHRTVLAFVSDHGEEFLEHGHTGHGKNLYEESLRVPLLLSAPGQLPEGRVVPDRVSVLDLLPTVLGLLGEGVPAGIEGQSLLPRLASPDREDAPRDETIFAQTIPRGMRLNDEAMSDPEVIGHIAVTRGAWKCVISEFGARRPTRAELYDLRADPGETRDVALDRPGVVIEMRETALAWWNERFRGERVEDEEVDPELEERLRALGYVE